MGVTGQELNKIAQGYGYNSWYEAREDKGYNWAREILKDALANKEAAARG